ncbi:hypothetical protein [Pleionea sp. CnH1-48]|uniref:hypothetical protein n=1 Tax=Pleionea sp. CnH1-48 TaxID=2954494 RepID=UPI002097C4DB|nr:hypothetical protein [Pleionea sp. CnH1-48]MCO7223664.1 hypothetical protein [Pleionea sp. CnH1-48]
MSFSTAFANDSVVESVSNFVELSGVLSAENAAKDLIAESAAKCGSILNILSKIGGADSSSSDGSPLFDITQAEEASFCSKFPCAPGCGRTFCQCYPGAPWCNSQ